MLDIPLFVLVLQIGLRSALNIRGYYSSPSPLSLYSGHTRQTRREDADLYQPSHSHSYDSDSDYSSDEEDRLSVLPLLPPRSYKRRKHYLGYSVPDYETTLESAPSSKPYSNNYVKRSLPSPVVRRRYWDHAPYLQQRVPSFSQPQRRNSFSGINDFLTSYANSLTVTKHEDGNNMLHSLVSLISQLGNDDKTRKFNRQDDTLSLEDKSDETSNSEEDTDSSLESVDLHNMRSYYFRQQPSYMRHNYPNGYNDNRYDLQSVRTQSAKDTADEADGILVTDDRKPYDVVTIAGSKSKESDLIINRNDNQDPDNEDVFKYRKKGLPYFSGLKHIVKKSKHYAKNNKNIGRELLLNARLVRDTDNADQFTKLRLSSSEENFDLQSHGNKKPNLRFLLLPNSELNLGSKIVSDLTNLLSTALGKVLGKQNLTPNLRTVVDTSYSNDKSYNTGGGETHGFSQNVNLRSYDDTSLLKRLLVDKAESNLVPYHESKDHNNGNKEIDSNEEFSLDTDNDKDEVLVGVRSLDIDLPILEVDSSLRTNLDTEEFASKFMNLLQLALSIEKDNIANETVSEKNRAASISSVKQNNDTYDEFSPDDAHNTDFTSLRSDKLTNDGAVSSTDKLHLEYPWNGQLSPNNEIKNNDLRTEKSENVTDEHLGYSWNDQLSSDSDYLDNTLRTQKAEFTDVLHLEHPWTDEQSSENENISNTLRTQKPQEYTDQLHLEYPWNDRLRSDNENNNNSLRAQTSPTELEVGSNANSTNSKLSPDNDYEDYALLMQYLQDLNDLLYLEYPWIAELRPDRTELNNTLRNQIPQTDKQVRDSVNSTSVLHLEYPWNGQLSSDNKNKTKALRTVKPENSTNVLDLEFPWNDQLSSDDKNKGNALRSQKSEDSTDDLQLEYPWNSQLSPDNENKTKSLRTEKSEISSDELHLEYPWNDQLSLGDDNETNALRTQNSDNFTNLLHLEYPWNDQQRPDNEKNLLTSRKLNTKLRRREEKYIAREYTNVVDLEFPWNGHSSPESNKRKLRSGTKSDTDKDIKNYNNGLEYPWNVDISQDKENIGKKEIKHSGSKNKKSQLRKRNKRPGHSGRSTYHDDSDDLVNRRAISEAIKHLEKKYDDLKKIVFKLPINKTVARTNSRVTGDSHLQNQPIGPEYYNYNRRVQDDDEPQRATCIPTSQEEKIVFKNKNSDEDENSSDSITFPLDRRPVARLSAHHKDVDTDRRSDLLLEPTDTPTDPLFNTTNDIEIELKNDTVNYVFIVD